MTVAASSDWVRTRLKYIADSNASVLSEATEPQFAFRYVDVSSVSQGHISEKLASLQFGDAPSRARRVAQPGDSIVSTVRTYLRAIATVPELCEPTVFSTGFVVISPRRSVLHPGFLSYYVQSDPFVDRVVAASVGVSYPAINPSDLMNLDLYLPPLEEQREIADFLDHETAQIDELIGKQQKLRVDLLERRVAVVNEAIASAPGMSGTPLRTVAVIQAGLTLGKTYSEVTEEFPYLRVANVQTGAVDLSEVTTIFVPPELAQRVMLRSGDVLMTEGGDRAALGRGSLWEGQIDPCLHQNHVFAARPRLDRLLPEYLVYVLEAQGAREYFESTRRQTTNGTAAPVGDN